MSGGLKREWVNLWLALYDAGVDRQRFGRLAECVRQRHRYPRSHPLVLICAWGCRATEAEINATLHNFGIFLSLEQFLAVSCHPPIASRYADTQLTNPAAGQRAGG